MFAGGTNCGSVRYAGRPEQIVLVGGITREVLPGRYYQELPSSTAIIYDIASDTWTRGRFYYQGGLTINLHMNDPSLILISGKDLPKPIFYAATVGIDDTFLMVGGQGEKEVYDSIYKYDNGYWLEMPQKLSVPRFYSTALMVPKDSYPICPN